ncbi:DnaJ domain-containing protein [Polyangium sorediatum]|uniref:J domain-containing protein n=1 Tax=Polyangium sorediatum TaxID=889274 RepID=A0ABT6NN63_9BACT|nr:J domain-containing protein [Polyangium sorediatum]MDI1429771.1 J domain-containing protein [Polyangium sorediatum]
MAASPPAPTTGMPFVVPPGLVPTAEAHLVQTPLLHLYVYLLDKVLSGTLVLTTKTGARAAVSFDDGTPTRVMDVAGTRYAERMPLERAMIKLCELEPETRYAFYAGQDLLAERGAEVPRVEPLAVIMAGARAFVGAPQAEATLGRIEDVPMGIATGAAPERFRLTPEERALVERLRKQRTTLADLARTSGVPPRIVRGVVYGMTITRHLDFGGSTRPPVGLERVAAARAAMVSDPQGWRPTTGTTGLLMDQTGMRPRDAVARAGDTSTAPLQAVRREGTGPLQAVRREGTGPLQAVQRAPDMTGPMPQVPPQAAPPNNEKRRAEVEAKLAAAPNEDHFQMLGVPRETTSIDVRNAYFKLALLYHPDKLPKDLHDLKPRVARLFAAINAAYEALKDDTVRAQYLASLDAGTVDEQAKVERVVNAALEFEKAEVFLRKNDLAACEACVRRAVSADPEQPAYTALLAWVVASRRPLPPVPEEGKTNNVYDDCITQLDGVLKVEPDYEKALLYRARLLKLAGRIHLAYRDFKRVTVVSPKNIEATREVRLYEMRHPPEDDGPGSNPAGRGLLGKLFPKKR